MKTISALAVLFLFSLVSDTSRAQVVCGELFVSQIGSSKPAPGGGAVDVTTAIRNLARFRLRLDIMRAEEIASPELEAFEADYALKEKQLIRYLTKRKIISAAEMRERLRRAITILQADDSPTAPADESGKKRKEKEVLTELEIHGPRISFQVVRPGKILIESGNTKSWSEITQPLRMASTQTTQIVWRAVVDAAKSRFPGVFANLDRDPSGNKNDLHPVETISYGDVLLWFQAVNQLASADDPVVAAYFIGHQKGDVYQLPTETEWEFVARARGTRNGYFSFGDDPKLAPLYAWFFENSGGHTHPVATKLPLEFDGAVFYDFHGNVGELTLDSYTYKRPTGPDPVAIELNNTSISKRGGSYVARIGDLFTSIRTSWNKKNRSTSIGFRIVRKRKP